MILTSNQSFGNWGDVFGDRVMANAMLDRILHHATTISIRDDSYRLKDKLKSGLVKRRWRERERQQARGRCRHRGRARRRPPRLDRPQTACPQASTGVEVDDAFSKGWGIFR